MDNLLNLHGKFFGTFWACETCAEVGWSPQFKNTEDFINHINKIHINTKNMKIDIDKKISIIVDTIKENEADLNNLIQDDLDICYEKIDFLIGSQENLNNLDDTNFKFLIKQIESFYAENTKYESLVNFNHKIDYVTDIISGKETSFLIETEVKIFNLSSDSDTTISVEDINFNYENEDHDFQCNICGDIFEENENLTHHIKDIHEDYYFDEENILLLKEKNVSQKMIVSKCKFCLDNYKIKDLQQHIKSLHYNEYRENNAAFCLENDNCHVEGLLKDKIHLSKDENNITNHDDLKEIQEQLKNEDHSCDATLACEDKQFITHKSVLDTFINNVESYEFEIDKTGINAKKSSTFYKTYDYDHHDLNDKDIIFGSFGKYSNKKIEADHINEEDFDKNNLTVEESFDNNTTSFEEEMLYYIEQYSDFIKEPKIIQSSCLPVIYNDENWLDVNDSIECDDSLLNLISDDPSLIPMKSLYGISIEHEISVTNHSKHTLNEDSIVQENKQNCFEEFRKIQIRYSSVECEYSFDKKYDLCKHKTYEHEPEHFFCDLCGNKSKGKNGCKMHVKTDQEGLTYSCNKCEYKSKKKDIIKMHVQTTHERFSYKCDLCDMKKYNRTKQKVHLEKQMEIGVNSFKIMKIIQLLKFIRDWKKRKKIKIPNWREYVTYDLPTLHILYIMLCCTTTCVQYYTL